MLTKINLIKDLSCNAVKYSKEEKNKLLSNFEILATKNIKGLKKVDITLKNLLDTYISNTFKILSYKATLNDSNLSDEEIKQLKKILTYFYNESTKNITQLMTILYNDYLEGKKDNFNDVINDYLPLEGLNIYHMYTSTFSGVKGVKSGDIKIVSKSQFTNNLMALLIALCERSGVAIARGKKFEVLKDEVINFIPTWDISTQFKESTIREIACVYGLEDDNYIKLSQAVFKLYDKNLVLFTSEEEA